MPEIIKNLVDIRLIQTEPSYLFDCDDDYYENLRLIRYDGSSETLKFDCFSREFAGLGISTKSKHSTVKYSQGTNKRKT